MRRALLSLTLLPCLCLAGGEPPVRELGGGGIRSSGNFTSFLVSSDGRQLVLADRRRLRVLDRATGRELGSEELGLLDTFHLTPFHQGSRRVLVKGFRNMEVRELPSARLLTTIHSFRTPIRPSVSPDGRFVAGGVDFGGLLAWDLGTGKRILRVGVCPRTTGAGSSSSGDSPTVAWLDAEHLITSGCHDDLRIWDLRTGEFVREVSLDLPEGPIDGIIPLEKGAFLVQGHGRCGGDWIARVTLGDARVLWTREEIRGQPLIRPNGREAILWGGMQIARLDLETGALSESRTLPDPEKGFYEAGQVADEGPVWTFLGCVLASVDPDTGQVDRGTIGHRERVGALAFSLDGTELFSLDSSARLLRWQFSTPLALGPASVPASHGIGVSLSMTDEGLLAGWGGRTELLDPATGEGIRRRIRSGNVVGGKEVLAASRAGNLSVAWADRSVELWDPGRGRELGSLPVDAEVAATTGDGQLLALADRRGILSLYERNGGSFRPRLHLPAIPMAPPGSPEGWIVDPPKKVRMEHLWFRDIDLSEDGERLLVGIGRKGIYLWDLAARRLRRPPLELPDLLDVTGPADGPRLALLTTQHEIRILSWPSGELERSWKVPGVEVAELLLSPDGENLAAGLDDGRILLWDLSGSSPLPGPRTPPRPAGR